MKKEKWLTYLNKRKYLKFRHMVKYRIPNILNNIGEKKAFFHIGINIYTNRERGNITDDPKIFNPVNLVR